MKPSLKWLFLILQTYVLTSGFLNVAYSISDVNISNIQQFEECVITLLNGYPFFNKENIMHMNKMLQKHTYLLNKHPERLSEGKEIRQFGRDLVSLVIVSDLWRSTREIAYISAIKRCSLLVTGNTDSDLQKAALMILPISEEKELRNTKKKALEPQRLEKVISATPVHNSETTFGIRAKRQLSTFGALPQPVYNEEQFPIDVPIESTIMNVLMNSPIFRNVFRVGMPQQIAKSYSAAITEAGLIGFDPAVINDAINAVVNDMSFTSYDSNTENYAFFLSRAISSILRLHNAIMFADGALIANNMLRKLEALTRNQNINLEMTISETVQQANPILEAGRETAAPEVKIEPPNINPLLGISMIQPSPVPSLQIKNVPQEFKSELARLLSESHEMSSLFCNGPLPNILRTLKMGLSDFGLRISLNAAIAVTNAMEELGSELACSRFADVVAEIVRNILLDNGMLETIDATEVVGKLISSSNSPIGISASVLQRPKPQFSPTDIGSFSPLLPSFSDVSVPENQEPLAVVQYPNSEIAHPFMAFGISSDTVDQTENLNPEKASTTHFNFSELKDVLPIQTPPISTDVVSTGNVDSTKLGFTGTDSNPVNQSLIINEHSNNTNVTPEVLFGSLPLEAGPWLPSNSPITIENSSSTVDNFTYISTIAPYTSISTDVMAEITSPDGFLTILMDGTDFTTNTPDPYVKNLTDAIDNPNKLASLFMETINKSLKALSNPESPLNKEDNLENSESSKVDVSNNKENLSSNLANPVDRTVKSTTVIDEISIDFNSNSPGEISEVSAINSTSYESSQSKEPSTNQNISSKVEPSETAPVDRSRKIKDTTSSDPDIIQNVTQRKESQNLEDSIDARKISSIAASSIAFIKSTNFNLLELCDRLNELAETVHIVPVPNDNCSELPLVDYLLHVLNAFTSKIATTT